MSARAMTRLTLVSALALVAACGGGEKAATPPKAAVVQPQAQKQAPAKAAPTASAEEQAKQKFATLSRDLEKLGKGEAVDRGWLESQLKAVLDLDPDLSAARFDMAMLMERNGDKAGARRLVEDIVHDSPEFAPAQENLAAALVADGRIDDAVKIYRRVIDREPKDVTGRLALARLLAEQRQYGEAIELSRDALQHQSDAIEAFRVLAESYEAQGNIPMAELIIGRGLKVNKDDTELHYLTAKILLDKGELALGVKKLKEIIALDPKWLKVRAQLAEIALRYRDFGNAAQQLEAILKEDPQNRPAKIDLAVAYKGMGRFDQAEKLYKDVLAQDPKQPSALWNLAVLYHRHLNRYDDAIATYGRYKAVAPSGDDKAAEVDKLVADIQKQKSDIAAAKAREEREKKKLAAIQAACAAVREGKKPDADAIGNDQERIEVAWQLMMEAQQTLQRTDVQPTEAVPAAEADVKCAFGVTPDTAAAKTEAAAPMRVMWTQILYQLGRLDDAMATIKDARRFDPNNPDAQLIEQQLKDIIAQQKGQQPGASAQPAAGGQPEAAKEQPAHNGKKRRGK